MKRQRLQQQQPQRTQGKKSAQREKDPSLPMTFGGDSDPQEAGGESMMGLLQTVKTKTTTDVETGPDGTKERSRGVVDDVGGGDGDGENDVKKEEDGTEVGTEVEIEVEGDDDGEKGTKKKKTVLLSLLRLTVRSNSRVQMML